MLPQMKILIGDMCIGATNFRQISEFIKEGEAHHYPSDLAGYPYHESLDCHV